MAAKARGGLGKGLDSLFEDNRSETKENIIFLRPTEIEPNKNQPRKNFDSEEINALASSIKENGLIQPIVVREIFGGHYQIVAGERRWRASKIAGIEKVPVIVKDIDEKQGAKIALVENIQRQDLNPIEEANAYKTLMEEYNLTQEALANELGKSRSTIANSLRLLNLPEEVCNLLVTGSISVGHGKILAGCDDRELCLKLAQTAADGNISVREMEKLIAESKAEKTDKPQKKTDKKTNNYYTEMELSLRERTGRKIKISGNKDCKGTVTIDFFDKEDLDYIGEVFCINFDK